MISEAQSDKLIYGIKIAPNAPEVTHLFFADDSIMFCRATTDEANHMKQIISTYQQASGQLVNYSKSELLFSKRVPSHMKATIHNILPMTMVENFSKYLGQPTSIGKSKTQTFNYIIDKVWKKLKGWKEKYLSYAGREILIKDIAQAIPTYLMSSFLMPKNLCNQLEGLISRFWWGSNVDKRKIHWVSWKKISNQKSLGGMGFRDIQAFNLALLAKQGWRIITEPNTMLAKLLKAKYFPNSSLLQAKQGKRSSYTWQSIQKASLILKNGCYWFVGNGKNINIWEDRWIHPHGQNATWTPKPSNSNVIKVADLIDHTTNNWNSQTINQNFLPMEANTILQIPLPNNPNDDIISWQGTQDGHYTVKSGYHTQVGWNLAKSHQGQANTHQLKTTLWNKLWKIQSPPKHLHLLWRIINNALPTKTNLFNKGITQESLCPRCNKSPETIEHVFLQCDWVTQVWFCSPLTITTPIIQANSFADWLEYMIMHTQPETTQLIATIT
jgi:hypothetical protein